MRLSTAIAPIAALCCAIAFAACSKTHEIRESTTRTTIDQETGKVTIEEEEREEIRKLEIDPLRQLRDLVNDAGPEPGPGPQPIGQYVYLFQATFYDDSGPVTTWEFETLSEFEAVLPDIFFHFFDDHPTQSEVDEVMGWVSDDWIDPETYYYMFN